jgi:hypothetical protein
MPRTPKRRAPFRPIILAPVLILIALLAWAFASPIGAAPDDDYHLSSIWCGLGDRDGLCEPGAAADERVVPGDVRGSAECYAMHGDRSAACVSKLWDDDPINTDRGNFAANYPPVYYAVMGIFAGPDVQVSTLVIRAVDAVIFVGMTSALFLLLPVRRRTGLVLAWMVTMVPFGAFLVASNNPSGWAILSGGTVWLALVGWFEAAGRRQWLLGALALLAAVLGAGARADSATYNVVAIAAAVVLTVRRDSGWWLRSLLPFGILLVSALFYFSTQQASASLNGLGNDNPVQGFSGAMLALVNFVNTPSLWVGVFGSWGLGWFDTPLPAVVNVFGVASFAALLFWGISSMSWRKALALLGVFSVLWLLPTYLLFQSKTLVGDLVQPRYILPLMVMGAGIAFFLAGPGQLTLTRVQALLLGAAVTIANAVSLHTNIRRYVTGNDVNDWNLDRAVEWWWNFPLSPMGVWIIGTLAFGAAVSVLLGEVRRITSKSAHLETVGQPLTSA